MQDNDVKLLKTDKWGDDAFMSPGFKSWDKGPDRFYKHEASVNHRESVTSLAIIRSVPSVDSKLSSQIADGQMMALEALKMIFTSLRFLATQNIAIQGHTTMEICSNFWNSDVMTGCVFKHGSPNLTITPATQFRTRYCRC
jgi:hypothetical protein